MVASLTYIARVGCDQPHIIKARLNFHGEGADLAPRYFASPKIVAERFLLSAIGLTPGDMVNAALDGKVATPSGEYAFLAQITGGYAATFIPLHPELLAQQSRTGVLQIRGTDQSDHWQNQVLDWTLRSANVPYDNLNELSTDFGLGGLIEQSTIIEAVAPNVVAIDLSNEVTGDTASIGILAIKGVDRSKVSIGYRVLDKGVVTARMTVAGDVLNWVEEELRDVASTEIAVPPASIINCYARYEDVTYHSGFIVDPSLFQNPRRAAYERFDPELKALAEALATSDRKRARDVEPAVASLLWMLGFNTCHLGGTKVLQDGPDILGETPAGQFIVVECTIGTLKADSKMHKLLARTAAVREQLSKSGHTHVRVLPVMATTLPHDEIASELGDAVSNGVYVIAGEDFQEAIGRTLIPPHADQLFTEAEQSLQGIANLQPR
ncbi:hypothetical protein C8J41_103520 [Sphingomonas sp. PP-CC-3G-468]|nr:hypothetical protein C8J39_2412 [Sphingomonas sp. PP-CC-1A-547]TCM07609.1 hypothetical protein C8J41_103520 [Sphingomonas sp. PP-CC-3G-468]